MNDFMNMVKMLSTAKVFDGWKAETYDGEGKKIITIYAHSDAEYNTCFYFDEDGNLIQVEN